MSGVDLPKVPTADNRLPLEVQLTELREWAQDMRDRLLGFMREIDLDVQRQGQPVALPVVTVAQLTLGLEYRPRQAGRVVHVDDEAGGQVPAFSDGATWRRCTDRAVVS